MIIKGLDFDCTCRACPEQYDVFDSQGNKVGYVRLRWGSLTCSYPDVGGETIYHADIGDSRSGQFKNRKQRGEHLCKIADKIIERAAGGGL